MSKHFAHLLKDLRTQKGWSMAQLAENADLSDAYISLLESNKRKPSHKAALKLSQILAMTEDQIMQLMTAAGYPNLEPTHQTLIMSLSFSDFTQEVLSHVRQSNYLVAEKLISQGLQKFHDTVQIKMLVAHLELARKHPELAITAMEGALVTRQSYPDSQVDFVDIYLNLGVCHFIQASEIIQQNNSTEAIAAFKQAAHFFEQTLAEDPNHFYCLDEYARCLYNLAHLEQVAWQDVVTAYEKILASRGLLSDKVKIEALCFSALAYTRSGNPELAQALFVQILFISYDEFTVHAFLCHCCYAYQQTQDKDWLKRAKQDLKTFSAEFADQFPVLKADPELALLFANK